MTEQDISSPEKEKQNYKSQLQAIIDRPLVPELIDSYAEGALNDLIELVQDCVKSYRDHAPLPPDNTPDNARSVEEAAFAYYELGNVEAILDNIADKAEEIRQLDDVIAEAYTKVIDRVIIPPDQSEVIVNNGGDSQFEHPKTLPKLKTLLFILSNEFGIDVHDPEQLSLTSGKINESMMRKTSYFIVEVPKLERTIFICDESNNITYVFNSDVLKQNEIETDDLLELRKKSIDEFLDEDPSLGKRVVFSKNFVPNLVGALKEISGQDVHASTENGEAGRYLYPQAPEGYKSIKSIAKVLSIGFYTVKDAVDKIKDQLGPVDTYRFGFRPAEGYSPEQQAAIKQHLKEIGLIADEMPEGYFSIREVAQKLSVSYGTVNRAVYALEDQLGEVKRFPRRGKKVAVYSTRQQEIIQDYLESKEQPPPEGFLPVKGIAKAIGVSRDSVVRAVTTLGNSLGETKRYRGPSAPTKYYSPGQQNIILEYLKKKGLLVSPAPKGYLPAGSIAQYLKVGFKTVSKVIETLSEDLGETAKYRFGSRTAVGYSPEQQEKIKKHLNGSSKS